MLKKKGTVRRAAAAIAVTVGVMAISGTGANAAVKGLPEILNGKADSQALKIELQLPSTDSLNAALGELGLGAVQLPGGLLGQRFEQTISLNHGEVLRSAKASIADHASGFAAPLLGLLATDKAETRCDDSGCGGARSASGLTVKVLDQVIPGGIGTIKIANAVSNTSSLVDTRNASGLAEVNLSLANIFKIEALAPLADALNTLRETVNDQVLPPVNDVLTPIGDTIEGLLEDTPLEDAVEFGPINPIPDFTKVDLLDLQILKSTADVRPFTPKSGAGEGVKGLLAESGAKVANLDILGTGDDAWAHVGAVGLTTSAFANGVKGAATADSDVEIVGADVGGLLGLSVPTDTLRALVDGTAVKEVIDNLDLPVEQDLLNTVDLIYLTAGIDIDAFGKNIDIDPKGNFASASAGTLRIRVEPKIPNPAALLEAPTGGAAVVPALTEDDFVSTGLVLQITLPNASSAASIGTVLSQDFPEPPTTGVALPLLGAVSLIGSAIAVRRFALAK